MLIDRTDTAAEPLPTGTVTFLFTDIEGSTRLLEAVGGAYATLLDRHRALLNEAISAHGGRTFGAEGDALFAAFRDAGGAIAAAVDAQRALASEPWPDGRTIRVRMGIHTGDAILSGSGYVGLTLHQVARITAAGHGGQVLVSAASRELAAGLPGGVDLRDLGEHRLRDLSRAERLYQLVADGLADDFPPPRTLSTRPNNLPVQLTTFVGRGEVDAAQRLLAGSRLLTLTGPGGTGKTRLALQLGAEAMDDFPDGVYMVELDAIDDAGLVPSAIVAALGLDVGAEPPLERAAAFLAGKRALLILDNFEQVIDAAPVVARLLREAAELKAIVTSRIVLRVSGEQEFPVPPLALPAGSASTVEDVAGSDAVRLFVERAMASQPSFRLDDSNASSIAEIVTRLDGLPLAIELAAARLRLLPVEAIRARLDQRLAMLTGGARDLPARQQTLRGAIDWSHDLLDEPDRRLFSRMAVFAGGAGLAEAEQVAGPAADLGRDVLDGLASLTEKSLLRSMPGPGDEPRFAMLATIREYGLERLAAGSEESEIRHRHAAAYMALVEQCSDAITTARGRVLLDRLTADHDNIRAALDWAVEHDEAELAFRMGAAVWRFWQQRGHLDEAHDRFERIIAMPAGAELPSALRSRTLGAAGSVEYWRGMEDATHGFYTAALEEARASGDPRLIAESTYNLGFGYRFSFETPEERFIAGREAWDEALRLFTDLGDQRGVANATWAVAIADITLRRFPEARALLTKAADAYEELGDTFGLAWAHHMRGLLDLAEGDHGAAANNFQMALRSFAAVGDLSGITLVVVDFASLALLGGDDERYWRLSGAGNELRRRSGAGLGGIPFAASFRWGLEDNPPDGEPRRHFDTGAALSLEDVVAYALDEPAGRA